MSIKTQIERLCPAEEMTPILVVLLGCDTTGTAQQEVRLRTSAERRAAVIGTIAMVLGEHATKVAEMLANGLAQDSEKLERPEGHSIGEAQGSVGRLADGSCCRLGDAD